MNNTPKSAGLSVSDDDSGWLDEHPSTDELRVVVDQKVRGQIRDLSVELDEDSSVIIRGLSRSYHAKQLAQEAVLKAAPVARLRNEIEVRPLQP
ncbi:hypothetical protein Isop_0806 [Isosphaera pallida ATCC 43644]|jgi:hypothetical protein|uniref:Transport-associated protein n=1 Tax=Isosphaera pallida (strain ATCC 43644 / DSM 9630 / IS1B) TaxID=575540 RepID=E8R2B2_ISOPI|nr:hypothetical protein [Isosphaera pallida]ADV61397.1 hypothetical protein Isop_0806 [Isosphaera pallida ATCC 43644]